MRIPAVPVEHPEVEAIQPSWHCVLRFRQRRKAPAGTEAALAALGEALADADIARVPPGWAAGQEAARWAVSGELAFPLMRGDRRGRGTWIAMTCLTRS